MTGADIDLEMVAGVLLALVDPVLAVAGVLITGVVGIVGVLLGYFLTKRDSERKQRVDLAVDLVRGAQGAYAVIQELYAVNKHQMVKNRLEYQQRMVAASDLFDRASLTFEIGVNDPEMNALAARIASGIETMIANLGKVKLTDIVAETALEATVQAAALDAIEATRNLKDLARTRYSR